MLDIGWTELVVIAIVLIVVVGPKDLPPMLRAFGRMTAKLRGMASDFRQQFDEALREADLDEVRKTISDAQSLNPANALRDAINPLRQMGNEIKADLQKAATPDRPEATSSVDPVTAVEPVAAPAAPAVVEAKPADAVAAAAIGSANRQIERAEAAAVPAEKPKRAPKAKVDAAPAAKKAASKTAAAAPKSTAKSSAKAPAKPAAEKSKVTPAAAEPAAKTSKPRTTARKKGEA